MIGSDLSIIAVPSYDGHLSLVFSDTSLRVRGKASSRRLWIVYLYYKSRLKKRKNLNSDAMEGDRGPGRKNGMVRQRSGRGKEGNSWESNVLY